MIASPTSIDAATNIARLRQWMAPISSALVAYSGGVDSALVLAVAHQCLGARALGCVGVSPSYPRRELAAALDLARQIGVACRTIDTREHLDARYAANPVNRCYFCKSELYDLLFRAAAAEGFTAVLDGTNQEDLGEDRPGRRAAAERGVRSPLAELGIGKQAVRDAARFLGLSVWDKPSMPCLSSRVPQGVAIDSALLARIERAEDALTELGFRQMRVRHHGDIARIEVPLDALDRVLERRAEIVRRVREAGYRFVTLDLAGFASGSLHVLGAGMPS